MKETCKDVPISASFIKERPMISNLKYSICYTVSKPSNYTNSHKYIRIC